MYEYMERGLRGDAKTEFAYSAGTTVMATMTVYIFPILAFQDQKRCKYMYVRNPKKMKVHTFTTKLM